LGGVRPSQARLGQDTKKPPPKGILDHLVKRFREGRVSSSDSLELKHWLESDSDVPDGKWFQRFKTGCLAGNGEEPSTFLASGMAVEGDEVQ
jgi:hypothetical protein